MELQEYAVKEIMKVKRKIAMLYDSLNSEYERGCFIKEARSMQKDHELVEEVERMKQVTEILYSEFSKEDILFGDKDKQRKIVTRKAEIEKELFEDANDNIRM